MDVDVHGPGIDARGATFAGISLYVLLGHGRDYAWSATSAGQDIIDTFAVPLCEPDGSKPTIDSMHYRFRGQCLPDRRAREDEQLDAEPGRRHAARLGDAPRGAHQPRPGHGASDGPRQAGRLHEPARDLLPRGRFGARVRRPERPVEDPRPAGLPARRLQDRLHLQLVLHGPLAHRVLQLGEQPGAAEAHEHALPGELGVRVAQLEHRPVDRELHALRDATRGQSTRPSSRTGTTSRRAATGRRTTTSDTARSTAPSRSPTGSGAASAARRRCRSPS